MLPDMGRNLTCERCKAKRFTVGGDSPPEVAPFIRGVIVTEVRNVGVCGDCFAVLCSSCSRGINCPYCNGLMLTSDCPPQPPPWWRLRKRLKWQRVFGGSW